MTKCIVFENPDGSLSIRGGLGPRTLQRFGGDVDAALAFILAEKVPGQNPEAINPRIVDYTFPPDREFRGAWEDTGAKIDIDLPKARDIQAQRINAAKLAKARDLSEREMLGENVAAEKGQLRAINAATVVNKAANTAALKAAWPPGLARA